MPSRPTDGTSSEGAHLRLLCPQWQGAGTSSVLDLASEFPLDVARRGYAVGSAVLEEILPPHDGPTAPAPVVMGDEGLDLVDGIEAKAVVVDQLARALQVVEHHAPERITTLGGECAVSVAPFSTLAHRYGDDLAILWIEGPTGSPWSGCTSGPTTTSPTSPTGVSGPSVPTTCAPQRNPLLDWLYFWHEPASQLRHARPVLAGGGRLTVGRAR
jgi:arginase